MKKLRDEYVIEAISAQMGKREEYMNVQELQFISYLSIGDVNSKKIIAMRDYTDLEVLKYLDINSTVEIYSIDLSGKTLEFGKDVSKIKLVNCKVNETQILVENPSSEYSGFSLDICGCKFEKFTFSSFASQAKSINIIGRTQYEVSKEKNYQGLEEEMVKIQPDYLKLSEQEKFKLLMSNGYIDLAYPEVKLYNIGKMPYIKSIQIENVSILDLELTNTEHISTNNAQIENLRFLNCEFRNTHSTFVVKVLNLSFEDCKIYIEDVLSNFYGIKALKIVNTNNIKFRYISDVDKIENLYIEKCRVPLESEDTKKINRIETLTILNIEELDFDFSKLLKFKYLKKLRLSTNLNIKPKILKKLQKKYNVDWDYRVNY